VSADLQEFALKVANALDSYAAQGTNSISPGNVPFHVSMLKMAQCLKHQHSNGLKKTALFGALGTVAPGMLAGLAGYKGLQSLKPKAMSYVASHMPPADMLGEALTAIGNRAGTHAGAADEAILEAIRKFAPGRQALALEQQVGGASATAPLYMGLAGLGGLTAGSMYKDRGSSGPPMIFK